MNSIIYGYIRVSSADQNVDRQLIAMHEINIQDKNIYIDYMSGKDFERREYKKLLKRLKKDDVIYIKSIDRLGRNYREILEQWRIITVEKEADIVVIDMPILDTRKGKDLIGTFLGDIVLQILSFVAENERDNIRQRQAEGIAAAKARGVKFGRPRKEYDTDKMNELIDKWQNGEISSREAGRQLGVSHNTFRRVANDIAQND